MEEGKEEPLCCEITGKCSGNTNSIREPDISCALPQTPILNSASTDGRDNATCCRVTGMCAGNSDFTHEPDVECASPQVLRPDATTAECRGSNSDCQCCITTGKCSGNTDSEAEPDVVCPGQSVLRPHSNARDGRDEATCCHRVGMCILNTDADSEPDISCPGLSVLRPAAESIQGRTSEACCHTTGMCVDNTDREAEPDIECCAPSVLVDEPESVRGRGVECCQCDYSARLDVGVCVASADMNSTADNVCTRIMKYAGCGAREAVLDCVRDPGSAQCEDCAEQSPFLSFQHDATGCSGQELCSTAGQCTYAYHQQEDVCEPMIDTGVCEPLVHVRALEFLESERPTSTTQCVTEDSWWCSSTDADPSLWCIVWRFLGRLLEFVARATLVAIAIILAGAVTAFTVYVAGYALYSTAVVAWAFVAALASCRSPGLVLRGYVSNYGLIAFQGTWMEVGVVCATASLVAVLALVMAELWLGSGTEPVGDCQCGADTVAISLSQLILFMLGLPVLLLLRVSCS